MCRLPLYACGLIALDLVLIAGLLTGATRLPMPFSGFSLAMALVIAGFLVAGLIFAHRAGRL